MFPEKYKKIIASVLLVAFLTLSIGAVPTKKVIAQGNIITDCASFLKDLFGIGGGTDDAVDTDSVSTGQEIPVKDAAIKSDTSSIKSEEKKSNNKEQCLDAIFYIINEVVIRQITKSVIDWINSGFDGNPAFVEDLGKYAEDIADEEFGRFLESSELEFLCSPFKLEIKKALILNNQKDRFQRQVTCRLSDVTSNIDNFISGDFADGGWDAWRVLASDNPYSAYAEVSFELQGRKTAAVNEKLKLLDFGAGFQSKRECDPDGTNCKIVTPGSVIEAQLNNVLPSGLRRLELADEFNEIVNSLFAYLVNEALTDGLRSLSKSKDSETGTSYTDDVSDADNVPIGETIFGQDRDRGDRTDESFGSDDSGVGPNSPDFSTSSPDTTTSP